MAQQSFSAWQAAGAKLPLELSTVELYTELGADEVEVKVSHCGVCHTDTSLIDDDWAMSAFPAVCGHEVVGSVTARGANVTSVKLGERVACANQSAACLRCEQCVAGRENLCKKAEWLVSQGGFGAYVRLHASFVFALPPALASEHAAPLMCAGSTVYAPLRLHGVRPGERVAVVGLGGLGHLAVQFARAWGTHVTVLSSSPDKEADARRLGAHAFLCTANAPAVLKTHTQHFDFMLVTAAAPLDWALYLALLRNGGTVCCAGVPGTALTIPSALDFVTRQLHLSGAGGCSRAHFRDMFDFAALHQIRPQVEVLPFARINDALDRVRKNQARYRVVLAHDAAK